MFTLQNVNFTTESQQALTVKIHLKNLAQFLEIFLPKKMQQILSNATIDDFSQSNFVFNWFFCITILQNYVLYLCYKNWPIQPFRQNFLSSSGKFDTLAKFILRAKMNVLAYLFAFVVLLAIIVHYCDFDRISLACVAFGDQQPSFLSFVKTANLCPHETLA